MGKIKKQAKVDHRLCVACGCCEKVCPIAAIEVDRGMVAKVNPDKCVGCGKCIKSCPASVIHLEVLNDEKEKAVV